MSLYTKIIDLQKLNAAWNHVHRNKPAPGVDDVTCEQFEENKSVELKQLQLELREHRYETKPVRSVTLYKGEKARVIALYAMRDKVLQQSLAVELNRLYDSHLSKQACAYRNGRSALAAVEEIEKKIRSREYSWVLKTDIRNFFDEIRWEKLREKLQKYISEEDVLQLIQQNVQTRQLDDSGQLQEKIIGIHQGSGTSPILSNIYLMDFDQWMDTQLVYFVRYSDDMVVLGHNREELMFLLEQIKQKLWELDLVVKEEKTVCVPLEEGVDFLGYHFDKSGKAVPAKAEQQLADRLEMMWLEYSTKPIKEKLKKSIEIIDGWEQYFHGQRKAKSIFEYTALVYATENKPEHWQHLKELRKDVNNVYKDITLYLADIWNRHMEEELELLEYEQLYQIWKAEESRKPDKIQELLSQYRKLIQNEEEDTITELMQTYTDDRDYEKAAFWMQKKEQMKEPSAKKNLIETVGQAEKQQKVDFDKSIAGKLISCFAGREDMYSEETLGCGNRRQSEAQMSPLTEEKVYEHLQGKVAVGTYIQRPNATVRYIVVDIDVSKKILLENEMGGEVFHAYLKKAGQTAQNILKACRGFGMQGYLEYSGCRGFHVWILFTEWIPVRYANLFCDVLEKKIGSKEDGINLEYFPNKARIKQGKYGQAIKLPCGCHIRTGGRSFFIQEDGNRVTELETFLDNLAKFSLQTVKKVLAANSDMKKTEEREKSVDENLEDFSEASANVMEVLKKCTLMRYLCQKARKTGYLTHFERQSILYVFGHMGEDGKQFVHKVISFTLNYHYNITEKFIQKLPEKPISCIKLRSQYKQITAEYGCNCTFKRSKNCYPSPVLHVIALSNDIEPNITIPASRAITKVASQTVFDELNAHRKAQELAEKILVLKRQKRTLDASIGKLEQELEKLYDSVELDCLEIDMGMLVRRKTEKGIEWVIEI